MNQNLKKAIDAIRVAGIEAVTKANSGHPGIVLGAAPTIAALFANVFVTTPKSPNFFNRDRFVLSVGHGSALLYSLFAACQYKDAKVEELINFRQLNSNFAGHPERHLLSGVDVCTGPLGQGVAAAVGLALAEARLNAMFKLDEKTSLVDHYTYALFGDGCFQEGIFHEAVSVASYYKLHKLILIYDSNDIQLDGPTKNSEILNVAKYFEALDFDYQKVEDGDDTEAITKALLAAQKTNRPSIIEVKTIIGKFSAKANSSTAHGTPLSVSEVADVRKEINYHEKPFTYSDDVYKAFDNLHIRGEMATQTFEENLNKFTELFPEKAQLFKKLMNNEYDLSFIQEVTNLKYEAAEASRSMVGQAYQLVTKNNPTITTLIADLAVSTKIMHNKQAFASAENHLAPNWNIGVREFAMQAINNGITAHGGVLAVGSTFMAFSDYVKPALRVGAISELNTLTIFSHDSITVGEDGPTHQPIEQLWSLRLTPNVYVTRPANAAETAQAFKLWLMNNAQSPVIIVSSRSTFAIHEPPINEMEHVQKGAYIIYGNRNVKNDLTIIATGSEVATAIAVAKKLEMDKYKINVVSMWSTNLFEEQNEEYINETLGQNWRASLELGVTLPWVAYADFNIGIDHFGVCGKPDALLKEWNLDVNGVYEELKTILEDIKKLDCNESCDLK